MSNNQCNRFVCADLHFGHKNNAIRRGFETVEEHDELIVKNWNEVVRPNDIVYILGDITMEKKAHMSTLDRLNGIKYVALGNHERRQDIQHLMQFVQGVATCFEKYGSILTHIPVHPREIGRFGKNVHGHLHDEIVTKRNIFGKEKADPQYICVSMEQIDYTPVLLKDVLGID